MPLSSDPVLNATATDVIKGFKSVFGEHAGMRPAHAKGELLSGNFTPTPLASTLSTAPHFAAPKPIWVRFSNSTGIPQIPDTDGNADPRGMAIRFHLGDRKHTDIVNHSVPHFPTRTGAEFVEFLQHIVAGTVPEFLSTHPPALAFVTYPKPPPKSYATQQYFGVTAYKLIDKEGKETFIRYIIVPDAGVQTFDAEAVKEQDDNYLFNELKERVKDTFSFTLKAQVAIEGDVTDDSTVHWADSNPVVELGHLVIDKIVEDNAKEQKYIIFDPIPRVEGIVASADPLLEMRAAIYLISGKERRAA